MMGENRHPLSLKRPLLRQGTRLGNYVVQRKIGSGSQAEVFLARDVVLDRLVALKVFPLPADNSSVIRSVVREARLIANMDAPNIVRVYHVEQKANLYYMAIEYMDGGSLDALVKRQSMLTPSAAIGFALAICDGLRHAHAMGIVHSDINPKNLLISTSGQLKIADFGLAINWGRIDSYGNEEIGGTPAFMAPEIWRGITPTPQSDIYATGACLYFMVTGRPPFPQRSMDELRDAHLHSEVAIPGHVPAALAEIIRGCMAKQPEARLASVAELKDALVRCQSAMAEPLGRSQSAASESLGRSQSAPSAADSQVGMPAQPKPRAITPVPTTGRIRIGAANESSPPKRTAGRSGTGSDYEEFEVSVGGLHDLRWRQADDAILDLPPYASAVAALRNAGTARAPLVVVYSESSDDREQLMRIVLSRPDAPWRLLITVAHGTGDTGVVAAIADALGVRIEPSSEPSLVQESLVGSLIALRGPATEPPACVHIAVSGELGPKHLAEAFGLISAASAKDLTIVLSCAHHVVRELRAEAKPLGLKLAFVEVPAMTVSELPAYLRTWTREATQSRFVWSRDALLLACDAVESAQPGALRTYINNLTINAIQIAANAQMRVITSWCVEGASQHLRPIECAADIMAEWRVRPAVWPPSKLLNKLSELRERWPTVGRSDSTETSQSDVIP